MARGKRGVRPAVKARSDAMKKAKKTHSKAMTHAIFGEEVKKQRGSPSVRAKAKRNIRQIRSGAKGPRKLKK